ncbi:hypothetical protein D3C83_265170 [compost metagenome]
MRRPFKPSSNFISTAESGTEKATVESVRVTVKGTCRRAGESLWKPAKASGKTCSKAASRAGSMVWSR